MAENIALAARSFGVTAADILSRRRTEPLATARRVAMLLVADALGNLSAAARLFHRSHTTIIHARRTVEPELLDQVRAGRPVRLKLSSRPDADARPPADRPVCACPQPSSASLPRAHVCLCGRPAIRKKFCSWVCARCDDIESRLYADFNAEKFQ